MANERIFQILSKPGFQRDGTTLDRNFYVDGQWTRFQRGRPKKMGGYKELNPDLPDIQRGSYVFALDGIVYLYSFGKNNCRLVKTTVDAPTGAMSSATLPDLLTTDSYTFQTDAIFDALGTGLVQILVHGSENIVDIADRMNLPVFVSDIGTDPAVFTKIQDGEGSDILVSGGVVVLQPFVFVYGNDGLIKNSNRNNPNDFRTDTGGAANEVNVAATKIVKGLPLRGGGSSPAGLFWSLDSLIRVTYASGSNFRYDTISSQTSILSPSGVIEYDGVYFWVGVDRFLAFDGTVKEIPNQQNLNWFFDNVNYSARTKIWATKVPRFGEIWWFFPFGSATECTHAIILNTRENVWYDVELSRSAGFQSQVFRYPVMYGSEENSSGNFSVFAHEYSKDAVFDNAQHAIPAFFETADFGFPSGGANNDALEGSNQWTVLERIEPDFILSGGMDMYVRGNSFAQSPVVETGPFHFDSSTEKIDIRTQYRNIRLKFVSNESEGHFEMGRVMMHTKSGDNRS